MTHWHDSMVDQPQTAGPAYAAGWTISGLAVLGVILGTVVARLLVPAVTLSAAATQPAPAESKPITSSTSC